MKPASSPLGHKVLNLSSTHRAINLRDWRPGNGPAILRPGTSAIQQPAPVPVAPLQQVRKEVKASVRALTLRTTDTTLAPASLLPVPNAEERVCMEFSKLEGNVACVRLHGITPSPLELERVGQEIRSMLALGPASLIVDVADVGSFHCALVNWLLDLRLSCSRLGGFLVLTGLSAQAHDMLVSTGLARKLHLADSVPEALATILHTRHRAAA
jgi:anti-anti-sigma regulatory factor